MTLTVVNPTGETAAQRLRRIADNAESCPEAFARFVLTTTTTTFENGHISTINYSHNCDLLQQVGLHELGRHIAIRDSES